MAYEEDEFPVGYKFTNTSTNKKSRPALKWSPEWLAACTNQVLEVERDKATANAMICDETCHSAKRSFKWSRRALMVEEELQRRQETP